MLTHEQVVDRIDALLDARLAGDRDRLVGGILDLVNSPGHVHARQVVVKMAEPLAADRQPVPGEDFHRVRVTVADLDGAEREGSVADLPRHVGTWQQIVTALANGERDTAGDLFDGVVAADWEQASRLVIYGLEQLLHHFGGCPSCQAAA